MKELHITLIRLLNELLPWEPKLLKAFYRNRARLKKESDDFKKHPDYENFVREEWVAFQVDGDAYKEGSSSMAISKESKDEDKNVREFGGPETTDSENYFGNHSSAHPVSRPEVNTFLSESGPLTRSSKRRQSGGLDEDFSLGKKGKMVTDDFGTPVPQTKVTSRNESIAGAKATTGTISAVTAPLGGFQRRCNPIQALLAKSVGNKVTLISHPQVAVVDQTFQCPSKTVSAALTTTNPTAVCQPIPQPTPVSMQAHTSGTSSVQGPLQVIYKAPEGLSLVTNNCTPVKFSVQPVIHQTTGEKAMQQVIILPTNLLIQKTEEKRAQQPCSITAVTTSKPATLLSSTPGFTVPDNRIPVQQVSPLKHINTVMTSSAVLPSLQKSTSCRVSPARKKNADPSSTLKQSTTSTSTTTDPNKCDLNQELKTVCIRDSQSILVTTRGGNTGVVKVQTSESGASVLSSSPVFTLPPNFQAFLVSKATTVSTPTTQTSTGTSGKLLPGFCSPTDKGISFSSAPYSPLKCSNQVKPSPHMEKLSCTIPFNNDLPLPVGSVSDNEAKSGQILIGINSLVPTNSQTNSSLPSSGWAIQTASSENLFRLTHKRPQESTTDPAQPSYQKVFVVTSTTNASTPVSSITTTSDSSAFEASRVKFLSPSDSACSTVTVAKGLVTSASNITVTTTSSQVMKPNLGHAIASTSTSTLTEAQGVNVTGLAPRTVTRTTVTSEKPTSAPKVSPLIMSSGQIFVRSHNSAANSCSSLNINGPVKATGSVDGKCVKFSICDIGHMASSELLSAVQQKHVFQSVSTAISVSEILNNTSEIVMSSSVPNIVSQLNKGTIMPRSVMQDRPVDSTSLSTASTTVKLPIISSMARISQAPSTTTAKPVSDNSCTPTKSVMASTITPPINAFPGTTTIQEKVVINTTTPLAPGTQLVINNTRFVVPAQGLAPGSHVLFISSPTVHPTGQLGPNPTNPNPRMAGTLNPSSAVSVAHGLRMVAPGIRPQDASVKQPTPTRAKTNQPVSLNNVLTAVRPPLGSINSSTLAQSSHLGTAQSSGQQTMTHIVGLPSFSLPEVNKYSAASSCIVSSCPKKSITVCAQSQISLQSATIPQVLQTEPASAAPKKLTAAKPGISWSSPVTTMSPMNSTVSRMQTLPVATVPPVGSTISSCQNTCVATVSPSINSLLMATSQPVSPVQPENIRMAVTNDAPQIKGKTPTQVSGVKTIHTASKLLSPDGAILNVLSCPSLQNLPLITDTSTISITTSNAPVLHILDSQRTVTSDNSE